jgi:hypothetical protein
MDPPPGLHELEGGSFFLLRTTIRKRKQFVVRRPGTISEFAFCVFAVLGDLCAKNHIEKARLHVLILEIHGGPFANYGSRFDLEKQLMAASGYVVLYTNPRGSTSYGGEFGNLIHHAYPGDDFFDLNSGVDAVVAKGYVDPNQLYRGAAAVGC